MVENSNTANAEIVGATTLVARLKFLAYAGAVAAFLVVGLYVYNFYGPLAGEAERWGQFGDYVGGVLNPIFGFLALVALLATLGLQIRELRISAMELRNSANALEKQYATLRQQTFEGTFFQTLRLFNEIVESMQDELGVSKGRHYLRTVLEGFLGQLSYGRGENDIDKCLQEYEVFYRGFEVPLGHYFRVLYNLVNLVKTTDGLDKRFYTNLIRAQLSDAEQ